MKMRIIRHWVTMLTAVAAVMLCACERNCIKGELITDAERKARIDAAKPKLRVLYTEKQVSATIDRLALELNTRFANEIPVLVCTLKGAMQFCGQLMPKLKFDMELDCVRVSSYTGQTSGKLKWHLRPSVDCRDRVVIICDDCLDTGKTLAALTKHYKELGAREVYTVVLIDKIGNNRVADGLQKADFVGLTAPAEAFLIGSGLDGIEGHLRNRGDVVYLAE